LDWRFSSAAGPVDESGIVSLMDDLGRALATGGRALATGDEVKLLMMGGGNPAHIPQVQQVWRDQLAALLQDHARCDRVLGNYDPPAGNAEFRAAMAGLLRRTYGWPVESENVAVTPGGQAAFFFLFRLLAGRHDDGVVRKIVLPIVPEYIGYADQGLDASIFRATRPRIEHLSDHEYKYRIDFDALRIGEDAAALCVSRPTNPTGNVLTDSEVGRLVELASQNAIPLIIDNAYGAPFPNAIFESTSPTWTPDIILTFSLSKLGLPGTRTGIVVADEPIARRVSAMTAIVGLANANLGQALVTPLVESGELVRLSNQVIQPYYREKSRVAQQLVRQHFADDFPYAIHRSEGAFFLWLWFPRLPISARELYGRLKAQGVLIVPGEYFFFGLEGPDADWPHRHQCLRMTFSQPAEVVSEGIRRMAQVLRQAHASG
jgi:valine--pyruvate aminotransferase